MKKTLRERYTEALIALGCPEVPTTSHKYRIFQYKGIFLFVGVNGNLRYSDLQRIDTSIPCSPVTKTHLLNGQLSRLQPDGAIVKQHGDQP